AWVLLGLAQALDAALVELRHDLAAELIVLVHVIAHEGRVVAVVSGIDTADEFDRIIAHIARRQRYQVIVHHVGFFIADSRSGLKFVGERGAELLVKLLEEQPRVLGGLDARDGRRARFRDTRDQAEADGENDDRNRRCDEQLDQRETAYSLHSFTLSLK